MASVLSFVLLQYIVHLYNEILESSPLVQCVMGYLDLARSRMNSIIFFLQLQHSLLPHLLQVFVQMSPFRQTFPDLTVKLLALYSQQSPFSDLLLSMALII